jgi:hypothetical protein
MEKRGRGNTEWVEKPPGKIFGEAMHVFDLIGHWQLF